MYIATNGKGYDYFLTLIEMAQLVPQAIFLTFVWEVLKGVGQ